ncbi:MAG: aldehyde dehydrogenase (NADP(+)) [Planctomycetaceae bacterium]
MTLQKILLAGHWTESSGSQRFQAANPKTTEPLSDEYPISPWSEIERVLESAADAAQAVTGWPGERFAAFLERYADRIDHKAADLVAMASLETALPAAPRLKDVELPRTSGQLRQAAAAARDGSWVTATIDRASNIRSQFGPIGPVAVFGPNNFPFAFNSIAGGDFAAAVAAGNPVIAKGHSAHPGTTRLFAVEAQAAAEETGMPAGFVQLIYRTSHDDGCKLVAHRLLGASGYTGSRSAGLKLKQAADAVGKPIYLELSSINPVYFLPGAIHQRLGELVEQFSGSCLMGAGQFCTNPGLIILLAGPETESFLAQVAEKFRTAPVGTLLGESVQKSLTAAVKTLVAHGAEVLAGGQSGGGAGFSHQNTFLRVSGRRFLEAAEELQTEAFGNESLAVIAENEAELAAVTNALEGNLTGCIYSATDGGDDPLYDRIAPLLRNKVGRLLNDKMPTGVAVVSSMNHGGPFPATGHPGFTAVGIPASLHRFAMLQCYDGIRPHRLPPALQDKNPTGKLWRLIDGQWSQADVG